MKKWKSDLFPVITLAVCLGLAACGSESEGSSTSQEDYEETENSVPESYDLLNDGRGDLIPEERIPVLMGGALPFTNMQNLRTENNEDGTYRYEDFTQDGQILIVNTAEPTRFAP